MNNNQKQEYKELIENLTVKDYEKQEGGLNDLY